jgi:succinyl-CoA synthetase alpha subunit
MMAKSTHIGRDTSQDDLTLVRGLDCGAELLITPSVDLAIAPHESRIGMQPGDLFGEGAVGA